MSLLETYPSQPDTLSKIAVGLSEISQMAAGYLGRNAVVQNWRQTRPASWRNVFAISKEAIIQAHRNDLTAQPQDLQLAAQWTQEFLALSLLVVVDLPSQLIVPFQQQACALLSKDGIPTGRSAFLVKQVYLQQLLSGGKINLPEMSAITEPAECAALRADHAQGGEG